MTEAITEFHLLEEFLLLIAEAIVLFGGGALKTAPIRRNNGGGCYLTVLLIPNLGGKWNLKGVNTLTVYIIIKADRLRTPQAKNHELMRLEYMKNVAKMPVGSGNTMYTSLLYSHGLRGSVGHRYRIQCENRIFARKNHRFLHKSHDIDSNNPCYLKQNGVASKLPVTTKTILPTVIPYSGSYRQHTILR